MKTFILVLFFYLMTLSTSVLSATPEKPNSLPQVLALVKKDTKEIKFYKDSKGDNLDFTLPVGSLTFPMSILEEQDEYVKVMIKGKSVWLNSLYFKLSRKCSDLADPSLADKNSNDLITIRGAGNGKACIK